MSGNGSRGSRQGGGIWHTEEFVFGVTGGLGAAPRRQPRTGTVEYFEDSEKWGDLQLLRSFSEFAKLSGVVAKFLGHRLWIRAERVSYRLIGDRLGQTRKILWPSAIVRWAWRNQRLQRAGQIEGWHRTGRRSQHRADRPSAH